MTQKFNYGSMGMEIKYDRHSEEWDEALSDRVKRKTALTWLEETSFDYWRHARMRAVVKPLLDASPNATWLTVGDGRYGNDAIWLKKAGVNKVHASDLSDTLLKISKENGFLDEYSQQNAEALSFSNDEFDFVFCKEAFHHFPRPYKALDELLRVSKTAVVLIEPRDDLIDRAPFSVIFDIIRKIFQRRAAGIGFEPVGNFIYSISERELVKYQLGAHRRYIAFKGLNDSYVKNLEFTRYNRMFDGYFGVKLWFFMKIFLLNILRGLGMIKGGNIIVAILFKHEPDKAVKYSLRQAKYKFVKLPKNPFESSD